MARIPFVRHRTVDQVLPALQPLLELAQLVERLEAQSDVEGCIVELCEALRLELFAGEPDINKPIAMAWDAKARLWVAENYTYAENKVNFESKLRDRIVVQEQHAVRAQRFHLPQLRDDGIDRPRPEAKRLLVVVVLAKHAR